MSSLPLPPRIVRPAATRPVWRDFGIVATAVLALGVCAFAATCLWDGHTPRGDWRLDAASASARGEVRAVERAALDSTRYRYHFAASDGTQHEGHSWDGQQPFAVGAAVAIEYVPSEPAVSRIQGTHHALLVLHWEWAMPLLLTAILAVGLRLARRYQIYVALRHGRAATAHLVAKKPVPFRSHRLAVTCRFRDTLGKEQQHRLHVAIDSELGRAVATTAPGEPIAGAMVVHQESNPKQCRLVHGSDLAQADA